MEKGIVTAPDLVSDRNIHVLRLLKGAGNYLMLKAHMKISCEGK